MGIVVAEFEFRHGGMAGRDAALEQPGKLIEIETAAERAKRRRFVQAAAVGFPDRMAVRAEFLEQRAAVPGRILRLRGGAQDQQRQR